MKKFFISLTVLFVLVMSACSNGSTDKKNDAKGKKSETITYQSENGKVEVPANPQRVVVLSSFAGNVMSLGVNLVGVDSWSKQNPRFDSKLKNVAEVSDENVEKIAELNPDLIIGLSNIKNVDKLKKIAPTVTYTYGKVDYLTQHLEIGKLLNKEKEAKTWVDDFKKRAQTAGKDIKAKIGEDATVSVVENFNKQLYVYGENWGRGTEILYQEMKLKMPEKVKEKALKEGYYALSTEVLPEFAGDYLIVSKNKDTDNSFQETESYKNIPAVKNNRVYEANMMEFYFNDPLTLDFQLDFFKKSFLGQ
ncbi:MULTISPECIES: iron-hydroxamate ABC transporter substrate-binding protein [Bacillus]|uniref:iron-hydroxamate ABC transporter substrate-binding protein n=1 Tax=Bacillus TaxID=1386 RepID=UPI000DC4853E|nr:MULTISPECIES: iron-hydroxamate ABC transporter substrate-binding protein [Bacillus]MBJ7996175.1 iron-hydroxamate ABC transporter substrate-binding protein [Bacillus cereus]MED1405050.1 iron-hydroxamate ABC transporter substrate-binding protein [Bacillus mycoides]QWH82366.1 iron-hydroxamate ABC transporter substrate-binding protein [Bacillus mycoides]QWI95825.1 iron-hydroxamate ABC transporter substrate-binding protein [Bacillus mycoides]RAN75993.1 ABC transporter substrate-binding protein [